MKKISLLIFIVLAILLFIGIFNYLFLGYVHNRRTNNSDEVSPMDNGQQNTIAVDSYQVAFEIKSILVNPSLLPNELQFTSQASKILTLTKLNDNAAKLTDEGITIFVMAGLGESGGIYDYIPEYQVLQLKNLGVTVARIKIADYHELYFQNILDSITTEKTFFYTTTFNTPDKNSSQVSSSQEINYNNQSFGIYCIVDSEEKVKLCDEFVENLSLEVM